MGTDCNVGKMVVTYELARILQARGLDAAFIATGQTGVMISGKGIAIDAVAADFIAGAAEQMVVDEGDREIVLVEGQGALIHPGYSGVTLALLHGTLPDGIILCHRPGREFMRGNKEPVASISTHIDLCNRLAGPLHPAKILGVAVNGFGMTGDELNREFERIHKETGLPVTDVVRMGADVLADAILEFKNALNR